MDIAREVILDLLPLYLDGEASASTKALVDQYLGEHADVADIVRRAAREPLLAPPQVHPPPDLEMRSLRRTMRLLAWKHRLFALALWLTGVSLMAVISFQNSRLHVHFLMQDYPSQLSTCAELAAVCWIYYLGILYKLRNKSHSSRHS